ncbi:phage tail protein, partial [Rhizobiaceae sp. 2RAB30]
MAGSIYDWSTAPGENATFDPDINWMENQWPDTVNDSARQMMGRNAEWRDDITGALALGGTANARTLSAKSA